MAKKNDNNKSKRTQPEKKSTAKKKTVKKTVNKAVKKTTPVKKTTGANKKIVKSSNTPKRKLKATSFSRMETVKDSQVKKRKSYKTQAKRKLLPVIFYSISITVALVVAFLLIYTIFFFPQKLNKEIKEQLVEIYDPVIYEESNRLFIIKLVEKPEQEMQLKAFNEIKSSYGLDIHYEKIKSRFNKGINKLTFYKNSKQFKELGEVYIYWDKDIIKQIALNKNIVEEKIKIKKESSNETGQDVLVKKTRKKIVQKKTRVNYEKIEEIRKNEKKDPVVKHAVNKITPNRHREKPVPVDRARIAIIIDDVGYSYNSTYDFLSLGFPVTFAIIPEMSKSEFFYDTIIKSGYDTMIHMPMEPEKGAGYVEKNAILTSMSDDEVKKRIKRFLNTYPEVIGANNHMGSKVVANARLMNIIMKELAWRDKLWVDSMTTLKTVSKEMTALYNMEYFERDVFLDNSKDYNSIKKAMNKLVAEARKNGYAVGIGHIQSANLAIVLKEFYTKRERLGIEFVGLKELNKK